MKSQLTLRGFYHIRLIDVDGTVLWEEKGENATMTEGINDLLDGDLDLDNLYVGLVDNAGFTAIAQGDTAAQIGGTNGWDESTDYTEGTRPSWSPNAAASRIKANTTTVDFTMSGNDVITGFFTITNNTKGGLTGALFSAKQFASGNQSPSASQVIQLTYSVSVT